MLLRLCFIIRKGIVCHAGPFRPLAIADTEAVAFPALPAFLGGGSASASGPPPSALEAAISASANAALPAVSGSDTFDFNVSKGLFCAGASGGAAALDAWSVMASREVSGTWPPMPCMGKHNTCHGMTCIGAIPSCTSMGCMSVSVAQ